MKLKFLLLLLFAGMFTNAQAQKNFFLLSAGHYKTLSFSSNTERINCYGFELERLIYKGLGCFASYSSHVDEFYGSIPYDTSLIGRIVEYRNYEFYSFGISYQILRKENYFLAAKVGYSIASGDDAYLVHFDASLIEPLSGTHSVKSHYNGIVIEATAQKYLIKKLVSLGITPGINIYEKNFPVQLRLMANLGISF